MGVRDRDVEIELARLKVEIIQSKFSRGLTAIML